jgi:hypothetical protein
VCGRESSRSNRRWWPGQSGGGSPRSNKRRILREAAACPKPGELGALLRHERLYASHLSAWRQAKERGELAGLSPKKRGPQAKRADARDR